MVYIRIRCVDDDSQLVLDNVGGRYCTKAAAAVAGIVYHDGGDKTTQHGFDMMNNDRQSQEVSDDMCREMYNIERWCGLLVHEINVMQNNDDITRQYH